MVMTEVVDQPPPVPNDRPAIQDLVIADMQERKRLGIERYGTPLQTHNGRDALVDAYQESLDQTQYLRQEIEERRDHRAEGAAAEREKIVGFLHHHAEPDVVANAEISYELRRLARAIERGEHHDTWPAPPPESEEPGAPDVTDAAFYGYDPEDA
jgi:hypothetical protein